MKLVELTLEQISSYWEVLSPRIEVALPVSAGNEFDRMNRVLEQLLSSNLSCWIGFHYEEKSLVIDCVITTQLIKDNVTGSKNLFIYTLSGESSLSDDDWEEGFRQLSKYGKSKGCSKILGQTSNHAVSKRVKELGGKVDVVVIDLPLSKI